MRSAGIARPEGRRLQQKGAAAKPHCQLVTGPQAHHQAHFIEADQIGRPEHRHRIRGLEIGGLLPELNPIADGKQVRVIHHC